MWCRCDSETGCLFQCDMYTGKKPEGMGMGLGESVVVELTSTLEGLGCEFFFDNFFNSPALQLQLSERDIKACGTVRANRKGMPKAFPSDKDMKRGDIASFSADGICCVKWMDNRAVVMLSNFISPVETVTVQRRCAGTKEKKVDVRCPLVVSEYNKGMGGVDLMDQKKVTYEVDRRSRIKYYLRVFFDLLDIGVNTGYIVYCKIQSENPSLPPLTSLEFRQAVALSLIGNFYGRHRSTASIVQTQKRSQVLTRPAPTCHQMAKASARKRCVNCAKSRVENRTMNCCTTCDVHLCFTTTRNCFIEFHNGGKH
ncbi:piggyBac transposable element-derived protein 4-like [Ornithodoros turicata]|uniref:piggyBac transposable element-derived protein 4-like n=1 Tax=Ornithodoros turicata TaxID=34597 RepID=UPI0031388C3D